MAQSASIAKVSIKHEEILNFLLLHPTVKLGVVAAHFDVSQAWLSCIIHSDAFQGRLAERQEEIFGTTVIPLKEKMLAAAHIGVDKLTEHLEKSDNVATISGITKDFLDRIGHGTAPAAAPPGPAANVQIYAVNPQLLAQARDRIGRRAPETFENSGQTVRGTDVSIEEGGSSSSPEKL